MILDCPNQCPHTNMVNRLLNILEEMLFIKFRWVVCLAGIGLAFVIILLSIVVVLDINYIINVCLLY